MLQDRLAGARNEALRRDRAATLFETLLRFATLSATARYLQLATRIQGQGGIAANEARVADINELLGRGTVGAWLDLMHGSLEYLRANKDDLLIPGLHGFYFGSRKSDRDAVARAHVALAQAAGDSAGAVHTLERMARRFAEIRDGGQGRPAFSAGTESSAGGGPLAEAVEQLCDEFAALAPCVPSLMVGHEEHPRRAWLRLLPRSGEPSEELIEVRVGEKDDLAPPGHLILSWQWDPDPVLLDLHPFALVKDSHILFLTARNDAGSRYSSPVLGIADGDAPLSGEIDLLGRYRIAERLGPRSARATDLETGAELELSLEGHGGHSREERSEIIDALRSRMGALAAIEGLRCSREILEVGRWVVALRPWAQGQPLLDWARSGRRPAARVAEVMRATARTVAEMHGAGHQHGRLRAKQVVIDERDAPVVLVSGLPPRPDLQSDARSLLRILDELVPADANGRFGRLRALAGPGASAGGEQSDGSAPLSLDRLIAKLDTLLEGWRKEDAAAKAPVAERPPRWWRRAWSRLRRRK